MVWNDYTSEQQNISFGNSPVGYRLIIVKSNLGFYNILALLEAKEQPDFLSIGPFRDEELSANYFTQILRDSRISPSEIQPLKSIYEQMPFAHPDSVSAVVRHILSVYYPEFADVSPVLMQYADQKRDIDINKELLDAYTVEHAKDYQNSLLNFLQAVKTGDTPVAQQALHSFLNDARFVHDNSMREFRWLLHSLNNYCHAELLTTDIHPYHIIKQMISTRTKIDSLTTMAKLEQMPGEICHKYCLLVKNYANPNYSKQTKDIIDYIRLHLEEELSLSYLADYFRKNASTLSYSFSKETGNNLTQYIQQERIREALRLFNTTDFSVSDVAIMVGYQDFSYFSKIFSKQVGMSPREYKRKGKA
ncbi:MAG: helix-turn-helix transcriptional regulator [Lachnospiraceae bacterium]|nr:helix-turn-helix transcriptional regulator [Lachnospiraceae bacterium]